MAELMQKTSGSAPITTLTKGQSVKGVITKLTSSEIFVDVGGKTHAMVLEKDRRIFRSIMARFKVGDTVEVNVLSPESEFGYPVVSLRRYLDNLTWNQLQETKAKKQTIPVTVNSKTAGGYLVTTEDGMSGFLPNSQAQITDDATNKKIDAYVIELAKDTKRIIFSQKPPMSKEDFEKAVSKFKIGQIVDATVTTAAAFGIFVVVKSGNTQLDGLVHVSEISWENGDEELANFSGGQTIAAQIIGFDSDAKRLDLSIKQQTPDPFEELMKQYTVDQKITGQVTKVAQNGVNIQLENGVEGFIRKDKIPPNVAYKQGQEITATVSEIDKRKHRLVLAPVLKEKPIGYR